MIASFFCKDVLPFRALFVAIKPLILAKRLVPKINTAKYGKANAEYLR